MPKSIGQAHRDQLDRIKNAADDEPLRFPGTYRYSRPVIVGWAKNITSQIEPRTYDTVRKTNYYSKCWRTKEELMMLLVSLFDE